MNQTTSSSRELYSRLVNRFGEGWEKGDAEAITSVFTAEGRLLADPFGSAMEGHSAIRAYWKDLPKEQAEVSFRHGEIFVAGPWFGTEFKCTFRRRRTGERVTVRGSLFCETEGEHVSEMRMYWHRRVRADR